MTRLNLNVYGSRFTFGLQGEGATPIAADALVDLASDRGFDGVEMPAILLRDLDKVALTRVAARAKARRADLVVSTFGTQPDQLEKDASLAAAVGARVMVTALENTLFGGDRRPHAGRWPELMDGVVDRMTAVAPVAERLGVRIGVENHQDVDSRDLVRLCTRVGNPFIGVTFDTANGLGVAEHPVEFAKAVMPHIVYVHLKDYRITWTAEGFQLLRCPVGAGAVPFGDLVELLGNHGKLERGSVEIGALVPRIVRAFAADFWSEYEPRPAFQVSRLFELLAHQSRPESEAFRTPFEDKAPAADIIAFEEREIAESLVNARGMFAAGGARA